MDNDAKRTTYGDVTMNDIIDEKQLKDLEMRKETRQDRISLHLMEGMSKKQKELYRLISPDGEGLTLIKAALKLKKAIQGVRTMYNTMKKNNPEAFMYQNVEELIIGDANEINNIYNGYKRIAASNGIEWNLSLKEFEEIVRLPCYECENGEPTRDAYNFEMGRRFKVNHLGRWDTKVGYSYVNCKSVCESCIRKRGGNER